MNNISSLATVRFHLDNTLMIFLTLSDIAIASEALGNLPNANFKNHIIAIGM